MHHFIQIADFFARAGGMGRGPGRAEAGLSLEYAPISPAPASACGVVRAARYADVKKALRGSALS